MSLRRDVRNLEVLRTTFSKMIKNVWFFECAPNKSPKNSTNFIQFCSNCDPKSVMMVQKTKETASFLTLVQARFQKSNSFLMFANKIFKKPTLSLCPFERIPKKTCIFSDFVKRIRQNPQFPRLRSTAHSK